MTTHADGIPREHELIHEIGAVTRTVNNGLEHAGDVTRRWAFAADEIGDQEVARRRETLANYAWVFYEAAFRLVVKVHRMLPIQLSLPRERTPREHHDPVGDVVGALQELRDWADFCRERVCGFLVEAVGDRPDATPDLTARDEPSESRPPKKRNKEHTDTRIAMAMRTLGAEHGDFSAADVAKAADCSKSTVVGNKAWKGVMQQRGKAGRTRPMAKKAREIPAGADPEKLQAATHGHPRRQSEA